MASQAPRPFLLFMLLTAAAGSAHADIGGGIAMQSDARWRGLSYSDCHPQAQASVSLDEPGSGLYGGAMLTRAEFGGGYRSATVQAYAGRVFGITPGIDGEAGLQYTRFNTLSRYDYGEAYAGLLGEGWNTRLYFSNDYFGIGQRSAYAEVNLQRALPFGLSGQAHIGWLRGLNSTRWSSADGDNRYDWRLGVSRRFGMLEAQLSWVGATRGGPYTWIPVGHRQTIVLGIAVSF